MAIEILAAIEWESLAGGVIGALIVFSLVFLFA